VVLKPLATAAGLVAVLAGCASSSDVVVSGEPPATAYAGPMRLPVDHGDRAGVLERSGAAGQALECAGAPYDGGSGDYDSGLESVQDSATSALENYFAEEAFLQIPGEGYRVEREDDGRVLFSYDVDGRTTVALVTADGVRDFNGDEGWGVETWAQCDPSELPAAVTDELGIGVWQDARGARVPVTRIVSYAGPEHCGWQDVTFLVLGGEQRPRQFLRDTSGELRRWLATTFDARTTLPEDATDTGFERDGRRLWLDPAGTAAFLVAVDNPRDVERWPAARDTVTCE